MLKITPLCAGLMMISIVASCQDAKKEVETQKTKMDVFISKTGTITKLTDTQLPVFKTSYGSAQSRIRIVSSTTFAATYFYQIEKEGKYASSTASIEYSDLLEVLKALKALRTEVEKDVAQKPDYLENKFITVDGFQVGYYVDKGKAAWFLKLDRFGSENTLFVESGETIENSFTEAKNKIDELRSKR